MVACNVALAEHNALLMVDDDASEAGDDMLAGDDKLVGGAVVEGTLERGL